MELVERLDRLKLQLEALDRSKAEMSDLAIKAFELSQTLTEKWLTADYATKRRIMEIVFLNCTLDDVTLVPTIRKPFDILTKGSQGLREYKLLQNNKLRIPDNSETALQQQAGGVELPCLSQDVESSFQAFSQLLDQLIDAWPTFQPTIQQMITSFLMVSLETQRPKKELP